jgi:glycosyltransferase involved in cell wall biosynthesis
MDIKKRIIINATCDINEPKGLGVFTREITSHLIEMQPDLFYLICVNDFLPKFKTKKIISKYLSPDYGTIGNFFRWIWDQTLLASEFNRLNGNLLFSTVQEAPVSIKNKAVVIHDILPIRFPEIYPRMKYYFYYLVPKILKTSRHIFFDSKSTQEEVFDYYRLNGNPHSIIYPGYNQKNFYPLEKGFIKKKYGIDKYFCYVGDMRPYKNLKNAIITFAREDIEDVYFLIAGKKDKKFYPGLKKLAEDLNLSKKVIFLDYIPQDELPHLYRNAIALFFPTKYEGFGLPVLEAMATGTPVITTKLTSLPEVCGNAAIYVNPDNIDEMAKALNELAGNLSLREHFSEISLQRAKNFSWEKSAREYYNELINLSGSII